MNIKIRQEQSSDYDEVYALVRRSFAESSHSDGTEQDYLNELRRKDVFIPGLSLVAENDDGKIIGQIVLYKTDIAMKDSVKTELVLSPLCVHPEYFNGGVATALMKHAFNLASDMGYSAVLLCGDPKFYGKFGFRPSYEFNIFHVADEHKNADWCMVLELNTGALKGIQGAVDIL